QSDVATKVAESIPNAILTSNLHKEARDTDDMLGYTQFLRGMQLVNELEQEPLRQALSLFEEATSRDPKFARAYVGIARCYIWLPDGGYIGWQVAIDKGRSAVMKALELNPDLAEAHSGLTHLMMMADERMEVQVAQISKAIELNPNLEEAYRVLANLSCVLGNTAEMVEAAEKAYQLDPLSPRSIDLIGTVYFASGRREDAFNHWMKSLYLEPYRTHRRMFDYYASKGDF